MNGVLNKKQLWVCKILRLPKWYFAEGWRGFLTTYWGWAKGYYKHPIKLFKCWFYHKTNKF